MRASRSRTRSGIAAFGSLYMGCELFWGYATAAPNTLTNKQVSSVRLVAFTLIAVSLITFVLTSDRTAMTVHLRCDLQAKLSSGACCYGRPDRSAPLRVLHIYFVSHVFGAG